jgi:hypothetical protein
MNATSAWQVILADNSARREFLMLSQAMRADRCHVFIGGEFPAAALVRCI